MAHWQGTAHICHMYDVICMTMGAVDFFSLLEASKSRFADQESIHVAVALCQALCPLDPSAAGTTAAAVHDLFTSVDCPINVPPEAQEGLAYCLAQCVCLQYAVAAATGRAGQAAGGGTGPVQPPAHLPTLLQWLSIAGPKKGRLWGRELTDGSLCLILALLRAVMSCAAAAADALEAAPPRQQAAAAAQQLGDRQAAALALRKSTVADVFPVVKAVSDKVLGGSVRGQSDAGLGRNHGWALRALLGAAVADMLWLDAAAVVGVALWPDLRLQPPGTRLTG